MRTLSKLLFYPGFLHLGVVRIISISCHEYSPAYCSRCSGGVTNCSPDLDLMILFCLWFCGLGVYQYWDLEVISEDLCVIAIRC